MNAPTEFDVGPLTWVKSEIDLALERADQALQQYTASVSAGTGDLTQIKFCRTHLHQVHGALTIVGLDGVVQFAEALENLLEAIEQQTRPAGEAHIALAHNALGAIGQYLDDLIVGQPNQPLRLFALYAAVQAARGIDRVSPGDLFFPDLSVRAPRRAAAPALTPAEFQQRVRQERARFQRGLLGWLRGERSGIGEMLGALQRVEALQDSGPGRAFWWVAAAMLSALTEGAVADEAAVKTLCARVDLQIRRLLEGSRNVAERLLRDVLHVVARTDSGHPLVRQVQDAYHLPELIPDSQAAAPAPKETVRRKLREVVGATEESWNKFCSGTTQALAAFRENALALAAVVDQLGHTDFRRLAQAIVAAANWLGEDNRRHSEAAAMEIATAILLAQNAQENFHRLGGDFAHQVDVTVARIHGCIAGSPPQEGAEVPLLDEMSRRAQEKLLIIQVAKEIQSNFAQIEQVLDAFFRDPSKRADLKTLDSAIRQVAGALTIMRHDSAVAALEACAADVRRFADDAYEPQEADFEHLASQLSLLGFFIDSLQHGAEDFTAFARQMQGGAEAEAEEAEEAAAPTVEYEIERQKRETHALLEALKEKPEDEQLRAEIRQNLSALQKDADLVADATLGEQAKAMLSVLDGGAQAAPQIDQTLATLKPQAVEAPSPSSETLMLSQASNEVIDAELLGIFIEEAHEVLATMASHLEILRQQPHDVEALTVIRRGVHTLKGSGRMVGLTHVGEAAWAIEQTLNVWLRLELEVGAPLLALIGDAHALFAAWVEQLESGSGEMPDPTPVTVAAEALRRGKEDIVAPPPAFPPEIELEPPTLDDDADPASETIDLDLDLELEATAAEPLGEESPSLAGETGTEPSESDREPFPWPDTFLGADAGSAPASEPPAEAADEAVTEPEDAEPAGAEIITVDFGAPHGRAPVEAAEEVVPEQAAPEAQAEEEPAPLAEPEAAEASRPAPLLSPTLYAIYSKEAGGHLETLQRLMPELEVDEAVSTPEPMSRAAHTLAGISATVGLLPMSRLARALENALLRRDHSAQPASLEALGTLRRAIGEIELYFSALAVEREHAIPEDLIEALEASYPANILGLPEAMTDDDAIAETETIEPIEVPQAAEAEEALEAAAEPPPETAPGPIAAAAEARRPFAIVIPQRVDEIDEQLLPIFLEEAVDLDRDISELLRAWRAAPDDDGTLHKLARALHTLKGSARMTGAMNLGEITHAIETRVEETRKSGGASGEEIDEIENAFESVLQIIERLQRGESLTPEPEPEAVVAPGGPTPSAAAPAAAEAAPAVPERRAERRNAAAEAEADPAAQRATIRVRADVVDRLVNEAGELSIARTRIEGEMRSLKDSLLDLTENVIRLRRQLRDIEIQAESQMQSRNAASDVQHADFDPLEFDRFTRFQELTRMMAESVNDVATVQQNLLKNLDDANAAIVAQARLNRQVQQELMGIRMVPFGSLADRLYRIVRQTSKELDKRVNLEIVGSQVELDRSVLDKMGAPLEHMLRNAIAHGIELREARAAAGKPEIGEISLRVRQEGNEIILSLIDDGAGLNHARIRERAIAIGLLGPDEAIDDDHLAEMIFAPGFSTASEISQIAGRGVGMDIVRTEVGNLGGRIEIYSTAGQGTEFRLYIPLTLAVTKALLVRVGSRLYAIPSVMIEQVLDLKEGSLSRIRDAGKAEWMGHAYPFYFLPHLLGETHALPEQHRQYWILLVRAGARRLAVQVDELQGNREIVVKNIGPQLARVIGVDGATVLGDGQVVLIVNPVALATRAPLADFAAPVPAQPVLSDEQEAKLRLPTVMVVDDSLTVRKITGRLLSREGYQVLTAKDGVEALEMLHDGIPDVMLVDIEMPRLDGFDLTRNIRADERLKHVPIIMITSRTADKHRNYAFEIGVNHYLGKPYPEDELLRLVAGYVKKPGA